MKKAVIFSLLVLIAVISCQVEGKKRGKPPARTTSSPIGWRFGNGPCVCKGPRTSSAPGWNRTPQVHPTAGHHPSRPHGPPRHHPSQPHGHHPSRPPPHNRHSHSPPRHRPPTRRPKGKKHRNGGMKKRHRGPHNRAPTQKQPMKVWRKCVCRKPAGKGFKIKFRMMKTWLPEMSNPGSEVYSQLTYKIFTKLARVLKIGINNFYNIRYTKGSIVAEFEVKQSEVTKDPKKALRHAIDEGQLSELDIQPESLAVQQSYSGVKLSEWQTDEDDCHRCDSVKQTRNCTEETASCDGIPLTRNASCYDACPRHKTIGCGGFGRFRMGKVMIIACFIIVGAIIVIAVLVFTKVKRNRRKYLSTSPSTSSIKKLADDDKLQSKC